MSTLGNEENRMRNSFGTWLPNAAQCVRGYVQRTPIARGSVYLGAAVAVWQIAGRLQPEHEGYDRVHYDVERFQLSMAPFVAAITYGFARLRPEDRAQWTAQAVQKAIAPAAVGAVIGAGAIGSYFLVARASGWLKVAEWGWARFRPAELAGSVALLAVSHFAGAWTEEMVFRGYGYTTLRLAVPTTVVAPLLTVLFGYYHGPDHWVAWHEMAIGAPMMLLRLASGGMAAPLGYHWAWNFVQTGILGPEEGAPSLRPISVQGPARWVGRPGYPEPGWLSTIVSLAVAAGIGLWLYRQNKRSPST